MDINITDKTEKIYYDFDALNNDLFATEINESQVKQSPQVWGLHTIKPEIQEQWEKDLKFALDTVTLETVAQKAPYSKCYLCQPMGATS